MNLLSRISNAAVIGLVIFVTGCTGPVEYRYYSLAGPSSVASLPTRIPVTITIPPVEVAVEYSTLKIAYRVSPYELRYDVTNTWVSKPSRVVQYAIYRFLQRTMAFEAVTTTVSPPPYLRLDAYVAVIEEDTSGDVPIARLEMELFLRDAKNGQVISRQTLSGSRPLTQGGAAETVAALSEILNEELARVVAELANDAARHIGSS